MNGFMGKRIWIVGGGSGIGRAIALQMIREGGQAAISGRRVDALRETLKLAGEFDNRLIIAPCDATDPSSVEATADYVRQAMGGIDILVVSVGRAVAGSLLDTSLEDWKELQKEHLDAPFLCCRAVVNDLADTIDGNILIIGSIFGLRGFTNRLAYTAVKGGLANFVRSLALDLAGKIRVNSICPGWVQTEMSLSLVNATQDPEATLRQRHDWHPMGRGGTPEEVAEFACFVTSEKASWMTGQNLALDGGFTAK